MDAHATPRISAERLLNDLHDLAQIGRTSQGGVDRVAGSPADLEARSWLRGRIEEASLESWSDEQNSIFGRVPGSEGPWLLSGSHTDTVPNGGWLDGAYGVVAALEVLRSLQESHPGLGAHFEIVSFHDEEGVGAGGGLVGSSSLARSSHLADLMGYLEIHIEQGPRLEDAGMSLGVVDGIVGIDRCEVRIYGESNHAGTVPFARRHDAGLALATVIAALPDMLLSIDSDMVGNAGQVEFFPGAPNVIPGEARAVLEWRALDPGVLERAHRAVQDLVASAADRQGCRWELRQVILHAPTRLDPKLSAILATACAKSDHRWMKLASGAGHDAQALARVLPSAMLFVPSHRGISHSPAEHTDDLFLVRGAEALAHAALLVLEQAWHPSRTNA